MPQNYAAQLICAFFYLKKAIFTEGARTRQIYLPMKLF